MGKRQPWQRAEWEKELKYLQGAAFDRHSWFPSYLDMQIRFCEEDGFYDLAAEMKLLRQPSA